MDEPEITSVVYGARWVNDPPYAAVGIYPPDPPRILPDMYVFQLEIKPQMGQVAPEKMSQAVGRALRDLAQQLGQITVLSSSLYGLSDNPDFEPVQYRGHWEAWPR